MYIIIDSRVTAHHCWCDKTADVISVTVSTRMCHIFACHDSARGAILMTLVTTITIIVSAQQPSTNQTDKSKISAAIIARRLFRGYEKLPPADGPTVVQLGIYINYLYAVNEQTMDYRLSFYLRQRWHDSRLRYNQTEYGYKEKYLSLDSEHLKKLWVPDVYISNEKGAETHDVTTPNRLIYLHPNGQLWFVNKITTTLSCPMKLKKYPLDTQECPLYLKSFGYPTSVVIYKWIIPENTSIEFDGSAGENLPEMILKKELTVGKDCSFNDSSANPPGMYPCLVVTFFLSRTLGYFIIQYYFPSVLLVAMSWVSFWISADAVVARVSIGLLTILNLVNQSAASRNQLPQVSYVKAIDVWMTTCLIFAFSSLIEFATVNVWSRTQARQGPPGSGPTSPAASQPTSVPQVTSSANSASTSHQKLAPSLDARNRLKKSDDIPLETVICVTPEPSPNLSLWRAAVAGGRFRGLTRPGSAVPPVPPISLSVQQHRAKKLDRFSRKFFPSAFIIFNLVYWLAYAL